MLKSIDTTAIASLNDTARRTLTGCRVQMTPVEKIVKLEKKMSQVQAQYKDAEANYGTDLLNLVVSCALHHLVIPPIFNGAQP